MADSTDLPALADSCEVIPKVELAPPRQFLSTVARNSAFVLGTQVVMKALSFVFSIYIVRRLGDENYGQYAAVMAFIAIFAIFSDLGMAPYMLREIARERSNVYWLLPNVVALRLILSALVVVVATVSAWIAGKEPAMVLGVAIAGCGLFLYAIQGPLEAVLMAWERLDYTASFALVNQVVFLALGAVALLAGYGFLGLLIASLVGVACSALLEAWAVLRRVRPRELRVSPHRWRELVTAGLPFGISSFSFSLQGRFDSVLMSMVLTDAAVGWYNVPLQLIHMLMLLAQAVCTSMFPSLTRAYSRDPGSINGIAQRTLKYLLLLALPIAVGGTVLAAPLILALYTEEFTPSVPLMQVLIWTLPLLFISELMGALIMVLRQERAGAKANIRNALLSVILNLLLVPTAGAMGAAAAQLAARSVRTGQYWKLLGRALLLGDRWRELARLLLASAAMGVVLFFARDLHLAVAIGIGGAAYLVFIFLFRAVSWEELVQLANLLLKRASKAGAQ